MCLASQLSFYPAHHIASLVIRLASTQPLACDISSNHSFIHSLVPTRFQPRCIRSYARLAGLADSRRSVDVMSCRPTSPLYTRYKNHLSPEACLFPWSLSKSTYWQIHTVIVLCEYDASSLVEAHCLVFRACNTLSFPPMIDLRCIQVCPLALRAEICSLFLLFLGVVTPTTRVLCGHVLWCDLPPNVAALSFVVTQLHKSDAPFVRAVEPTEHESSRANLLRPCRLCRGGTTPLTRGATVDEAVW